MAYRKAVTALLYTAALGLVKQVGLAFVKFLAEFEANYPKMTLREKVRAYLIDCKISEKTIDKVVSILKK